MLFSFIKKDIRYSISDDTIIITDFPILIFPLNYFTFITEMPQIVITISTAHNVCKCFRTKEINITFEMLRKSCILLKLGCGSWGPPFTRVSLTGDHNTESFILSDKQNRLESRLTSVGLNLKNSVHWCFRGWNKILSDVHSCLFHAITNLISRQFVHILRGG